MLWKSPEINHTNWQTYDFTIVPQSQEISYLILEVDYVALPAYFGNILIDNIVEKKSPDPASCIVETFNVFTPNGDGYNDVFHIKSANDIAKFKLQIYNRWGNLVFETKDFRQGWDGTHKGDKCPAGVYFWNIDYMCIEGNSIGEYKRRGSLTLLN